MVDFSIKDLNILYVEDDETARTVISETLQRRCRQILQAENGESGLALFRDRNPDLVITDLCMPVMDGLTMIREIRRISQDVPIIVTSAHSDTSFLIEAIDLGIDRYVLKPVETPKLLGAINRCVSIMATQREARLLQEEREKLIGELQEALTKVKLLSGFLPICASCKKIRNDKGYWQQIEQYIAQHSEATFSHGICPDCVRTLYPEFVDDKDKTPPTPKP